MLLKGGETNKMKMQIFQHCWSVIPVFCIKLSYAVKGKYVGMHFASVGNPSKKIKLVPNLNIGASELHHNLRKNALRLRSYQ